MFVSYIKTSLGIIKIVANDFEIVFVGIVEKIENDTNNSDLTVKCEIEIFEYLNGQRFEFDLPYKIYGTDFQKQVLSYLPNIKYGTTITYKELSDILNVKNGSRAIGNALNHNPLILLLPCHRVVGANQKLIGYKYGIDIKQKLLNIEANNKK